MPFNIPSKHRIAGLIAICAPNPTEGSDLWGRVEKEHMNAVVYLFWWTKAQSVRLVLLQYSGIDTVDYLDPATCLVSNCRCYNYTTNSLSELNFVQKSTPHIWPVSLFYGYCITDNIAIRIFIEVWRCWLKGSRIHLHSATKRGPERPWLLDPQVAPINVDLYIHHCNAHHIVMKFETRSPISS